MKAISLLLLLILCITTFFTSSLCCPPPLNNRRYENATLLAEVVAEVESNPQMSWATVVQGNSPITVWPIKDPNKIVFIPYCFLAANQREGLLAVFEASWRLWYNPIGNAGPGKGYRLGGSHEFKKDEKIISCLNEKWEWNPDVPKDTLAIMPGPSGKGFSAIHGYRPLAWDQEAPRRHSMVIEYPIKNRDIWTTKIAHEMGHVLGFTHGHQRPDRDHHVRFNCRNIKGYEEIKAAVTDHHDMTIEKLCSSAVYASMAPWGYVHKYNFAAPDFSTEARVEFSTAPDGRNRKDYPLTIASGDEYDAHSIMHYTSDSYTGKSYDQITLENASLTMWKGAAPDYKPPEKATAENSRRLRRSWNSKPSSKDVEGVKKLYPWTD